MAAYPPADIAIEHIGDWLDIEIDIRAPKETP